MAPEVVNVVMEMLRKIQETQSTHGRKLDELIERTGNLERSYASLSTRLDTLSFDVERIKRRLELVEEPASP